MDAQNLFGSNENGKNEMQSRYREKPPHNGNIKLGMSYKYEGTMKAKRRRRTSTANSDSIANGVTYNTIIINKIIYLLSYLILFCGETMWTDCDKEIFQETRWCILE